MRSYAVSKERALTFDKPFDRITIEADKMGGERCLRGIAPHRAKRSLLNCRMKLLIDRNAS